MFEYQTALSPSALLAGFSWRTNEFEASDNSQRARANREGRRPEPVLDDQDIDTALERSLDRLLDWCLALPQRTGDMTSELRAASRRTLKMLTHIRNQLGSLDKTQKIQLLATLTSFGLLAYAIRDHESLTFMERLLGTVYNLGVTVLTIGYGDRAPETSPEKLAWLLGIGGVFTVGASFVTSAVRRGFESIRETVKFERPVFQAKFVITDSENITHVQGLFDARGGPVETTQIYILDSAAGSVKLVEIDGEMYIKIKSDHLQSVWVKSA